MDKNPAQENNKRYYVRSSEIHEVTSTGMLPLILLDRERLESQKGYRRVKRIFDLCVSIMGGIILFMRWRYNRDNQGKVPILNVYWT